MPIIGTVAAVVGTVVAIKGAQDSRRAQEETARLKQQQQELASRRSQRKAIREAQLVRAQAIASAQGSGTLQGSGAAGGIGSISSQLGTELGFASQMTGLSRDITQSQINASNAAGRADFGSSLVGIGDKLVNFGRSAAAEL